MFDLFPVLRERRPAGGNAVGRRAADGGDQASADGPAGLLLLDEPSVGIAHRLKIEIFDAIRSIAASGVAVLMAEQDAQNTLRVAQRVYVLENGKVARSGSSEALKSDDHIRRIYLGV